MPILRWLVFLPFIVLAACSPDVAVEDSAQVFCGSSSFGSCVADAECKVGGCSGQICQAASEEDAITTCEWKDCYDNAGLRCQCKDRACQWA